MQCSWNRRCCQCQYINCILDLLDLLLMTYTKTLLLIYDKQPQLLFARSTDPGQHIYTDREILHSLHESIVMLLRKNGSRYKKCYLFAILHCLKCCTDCNLCLTISHVPTDQSVHDT